MKSNEITNKNKNDHFMSWDTTISLIFGIKEAKIFARDIPKINNKLNNP